MEKGLTPSWRGERPAAVIECSAGGSNKAALEGGLSGFSGFTPHTCELKRAGQYGSETACYERDGCVEGEDREVSKEKRGEIQIDCPSIILSLRPATDVCPAFSAHG